VRTFLTLLGAMAGLVAGAGCSIDFVALDDAPTGTAIEVTSLHADSLRVAVRVEHRGGFVESVGVNDERRVPPGSGVEEELTFEFDLTVDPAEPVLDIYVDRELNPPRPLELRVPLLVRAGEATCSPEGGITLPFELDESGTAGLRRSWAVELVDSAGGAVLSIRSETGLPRPVTVPDELVGDSVTTARLSVSVWGPVEEAPYDAFLGVSTAAEWAVPNTCP
jgi:hypothetical protein